MNKIYVAGPMTGYEKHNFPAFNEVTRELRSRGYTVVNPVEIDARYGITEHTNPREIPMSLLAIIMLEEFREIETCDTIVLLPGWRKSKGVREAELRWARYLNVALGYNIQVYEWVEGTLQGVPLDNFAFEPMVA